MIKYLLIEPNPATYEAHFQYHYDCHYRYDGKVNVPCIETRVYSTCNTPQRTSLEPTQTNQLIPIENLVLSVHVFMDNYYVGTPSYISGVDNRLMSYLWSYRTFLNLIQTLIFIGGDLRIYVNTGSWL